MSGGDDILEELSRLLAFVKLTEQTDKYLPILNFVEYVIWMEKKRKSRSFHETMFHFVYRKIPAEILAWRNVEFSTSDGKNGCV